MLWAVQYGLGILEIDSRVEIRIFRKAAVVVRSASNSSTNSARLCFENAVEMLLCMTANLPRQNASYPKRLAENAIDY